MTMRGADGILLQQVIQQMRRTSPHRHKLEEAMLACAWKAVMPLSVFQRTESTFLKQGKLFVKLSSAPLRQEFQLNKDKVIALLRNHAQGCELEDVVFL